MPKPVIPIKPPYEPELLPIVQEAIRGILENWHRVQPQKVFEYGSGHSTLWFSTFSDVVSVEHDQQWYKEVVREVDKAGLGATVHLADKEDIASTILDYGDFDLILIDCFDKQRMPALKMAREHVRPGGWLVLDDSHWRLLWGAFDYLEGWQGSIIRGEHKRKDGQWRTQETTFFKRPIDG